MKKTMLSLVACLFTVACAMASDEGRIRSLIFLIGDGMGLSQVSMLQFERGDTLTAFDRAQNVALIRTGSANNRVTDSAAAGTALASGFKTDNGTLGQDPEGNPFESSMARAREKGMATGIVVTSYLQHATPAGFYAHVADRGDVSEITRQLLDSKIDVLFGGGRKWLEKRAPEGGSYLEALARRGYVMADSLSQLRHVDRSRVACVVAEKHLPEAPRRGDFLPRATEKALELLSAEASARETGFLLLVEGSQIDFAGHDNDAERLLAEMRDFERAVAVAMDYADRTPGTLVVVTADHETGGVTIPANKRDFTLGENGLRYLFSTGGHTATMVPVYLYGTGTDRITGVMDNTELAHRIMQLLDLE